MFASKIKLRVRYGETDQMGYVYYGNYASFFEVGRVEALRNLGYSYKGLEDDGIMLPVFSYNVVYLKPAFYDDLLTVHTRIRQVPGARIMFEYEIENQKGEKISEAETTLVFISKETGKPMKAPEGLIQKLDSVINGKA